MRVILNAAPAREMSPVLRGAVDVLVVNAVEAEMMGAGAVTDLASALAAARHLAAVQGSVIVTAGARGLAACTQGEAQIVLPARAVQAVSTHGAGDCFTGALAAALARGVGLAEACTLASDAAADHVARPAVI